MNRWALAENARAKTGTHACECCALLVRKRPGAGVLPAVRGQIICGHARTRSWLAIAAAVAWQPPT